MTSSDVALLPGLPGDNPLGFLAALGVQVALADQNADHRLHWTDDPIPHPVLSPALDLDRIARAVRVAAKFWLEGPALAQSIDPGLKLKPDDIREYLRRGRAARSSGSLSACLLAENSLDNNCRAKPSDLYFTAGQQKFVSMARTILGEVTEEEIVDDMATPWRYHSERESLMWDCVDDRDHALSAADPTDKSRNPKLTNPGAEALAVIGLSRYPCFASPQGTLTQGCSGSWKQGSFVWPLWSAPATARSVRSLLAQVAAPLVDDRRADWYRSWGIARVLQSQIRRSSQGGYGTFGPPRVVWQRD
ncbi:MAG: hypothetical protein F4Z34_09125 [Acidimicrobiaceae bacterium]|nr:hypothetical protein [Acidimicrobiaceae bacterium]